MSSGLLGPTTTETITGGKTLELTDYDRRREPHKIVNDGTMVTIGARTLSSEICCPICLDLFTTTYGTKECLHRFCFECINTALLRNNKECPTCRKKIVSKRSLRPDTNLDGLLSKIWSERRMYDELQNEALKNYHQQNSVIALQKSISAGIKAQAQNRRQRVQGSYDYEKRKKKRKAAPDAEHADTAPNSPTEATPPVGGAEDANGGESHSNAHATTSVAGVASSSTHHEADGSSSIEDSSTELSSELSSSLSDTDDLDSRSSDCGGGAGEYEERSRSSADPTTSNGKSSAPPSLDNMATSPTTAAASTADDGVEASDRLYNPAHEIELQLVASRALIQRAECAPALKRSRYIRAHRNITMEHLCEFLQKAARAELDADGGEPIASTSTNVGVAASAATTVDTPSFFYAYDAEYKLYAVPLNETLKEVHYEAPPNASDHIRVYFDTHAPSGDRLESQIVAAASYSGDAFFEDSS